MAKSGAERLGDLAQAAKALKDIIQAALRGGWQAAALETVKHFWPYILIAAVVLLFLPVIIFCCLPAVLFGFGGTSDADISAINAQADRIRGYYAQYGSYCTQRVDAIKESVIHGKQNGDDTVHQPAEDNTEYEIVIVGGQMDKDWFVALYSVSVGNDLRNMSESGIKDFVAAGIPYAVTDKEPEETELSEPSGDDTVHEPPSEGNNNGESPETATKLLTITYLTPEQILAGYSEADRNWAELMYTTLSGGGTMPNPGPGIGSGELASPFPSVDWHGILTSGYGYRIDPVTGSSTKFHSGLDLAMPMGTDIHAAKAGTVSLVQYSNSGYGYHIILDHGDGLQTLYGHCSELLVYEGQQITQGQVIARVGSTGNSTGPHCHFEVRIDKKHVDPTGYLP